MTAESVLLARRKKLKTPRAAAIAGILFGLLYGSSLALIRAVTPDVLAGANVGWLEENAGKFNLALNLVPYAGIAFLWFIGVIRDRLGEMEDRLFSTVFLGSGLLFLATTFVGAALAGGLLTSVVSAPDTLVDSGVYTYSRAVMYQILNVYSIRMAGVFMISLSTIWRRTGTMHRGWVFVTYALALVLLVSINLSLWVAIIFPGWVLTVSVAFLISNFRNRAEETAPEA
jgi:hypothetical protein